MATRKKAAVDTTTDQYMQRWLSWLPSIIGPTPPLAERDVRDLHGSKAVLQFLVDNVRRRTSDRFASDTNCDLPLCSPRISLIYIYATLYRYTPKITCVTWNSICYSMAIPAPFSWNWPPRRHVCDNGFLIFQPIFKQLHSYHLFMCTILLFMRGQEATSNLQAELDAVRAQAAVATRDAHHLRTDIARSTKRYRHLH